jgi:hypothetical protein
MVLQDESSFFCNLHSISTRCQLKHFIYYILSGYLLANTVLRLKLNLYLIKNIMKNLFKFGFLALAISLTVAACGGGKGDATDSTATDSTMTDTSMTTVDTSATATDSMAVDTLAKDSTKM